MNTNERIEEFMNKLESWGLFNDLTEKDKMAIKTDLKNIAGDAVIDATRKIQNTLRDLYNDIANNK